MKKLMSFAIVAAVPLGIVALVRSVGNGHDPRARRRRKFQRMKRRLGRRADALGDTFREAMPDLHRPGHRKAGRA